MNHAKHSRPYALHLLFLFPLLLLSTCKKDAEDCSAPCPCTGDACIEEMKDWFLFQPGTYWIYEEQSSGALDTVLVLGAVESENSFFMETESSVLEEWIPNLWVKYKYRYQYYGDNNCITRPDCTCHRLNRIKGRTGDYVGESVFLTYPPIVGDYIYPYGGGQAIIETKQDSLMIGAFLFLETFSVHNQICVTENGRAVTFYFSKYHGIVRKDYPAESEVWNLIEFNINQ